MHSAYPYRPLGSQDEIRLLRFKCLNDETNSLECALEHVKSGKDTPYTALSYSWPVDNPTVPIIIDGHTVLLASTVDQALRLIQQQDANAAVWIDQICINQDDNDEKSGQVQLMRSIYANAAQTIAWLGPAADNSDELIVHLDAIYDEFESKNYDTIFHRHADEELVERIRHSFNAFCSRRYWKRLWVIQEFTMSPNLRIFCGQSSITYEKLGKVAWWSGLSYDEVLPKHVDEDAIYRVQQIYQDAPQLSFMQSILTRRARFKQETDGGYKNLFFEVLLTSLVLQFDYNHPETSDSRDRVFSLLHLSRDVDEFLDFPDYNLSCEEVYEETARKFIEQGNIDIMGYCEFPRTPNTGDLPSWAPDWRMRTRAPFFQFSWTTSFYACGTANIPAKPTSSKGNKIIGLDGVFVDTVKELGATWEPNWLQPLDITKLAAYLDSIRAFCKRSPQIRKHEEELDICRIAMADLGWDASWTFEDLVGSCLDGFRNTLDWIKKQEKLQPGDTPLPEEGWYIKELRYLRSVRPFISESGFVGLAPGGAEHGDSIYIFAGAKSPYLIRPSGHADESYIQVGPTYVHGIMYGEFMKGNPGSETVKLR